jgi:hypothetical protein
MVTITLAEGDDSIASVEFDPQPTRLISGCRFCRVDTFSTCSKCTYVPYCCLQHEVADAAYHAPLCSTLRLFGNPSSMMSIEFLAFLRTLLEADTDFTISCALTLSLQRLQTTPVDREGIRHIVPFVFLRLGMLQESFDFCLAWSNTGHMMGSEDVYYDLCQPRPFGIDHQHLFELPESLFVAPICIYYPQTVALMLLKVRLYLSVKSLSTSIHMIELRRNLRRQLITLYLKINAGNFAFWRRLLDQKTRPTREPSTTRNDQVEDEIQRLLLLS